MYTICALHEVSRHRTSEGLVSYHRCRCGRLEVRRQDVTILSSAGDTLPAQPVPGRTRVTRRWPGGWTRIAAALGDRVVAPLVLVLMLVAATAVPPAALVVRWAGPVRRRVGRGRRRVRRGGPAGGGGRGADRRGGDSRRGRESTGRGARPGQRDRAACAHAVAGLHGPGERCRGYTRQPALRPGEAVGRREPELADPDRPGGGRGL
ncbi:hypothetical protein HBB16_00150 [Pseudonocardia sp. MCCB 268]|nr:hypothetical protein [Pseudonocardia cytotoxica]